jgi:putative transposase
MPTPEQAETLSQFAGAARYVYNLALEQRRDFWRQYRGQIGRHISYESQARELTELRRNAPWLAEVHVTPLQQALRDLDRAFSNFFSGRSRYPAFRRKEANNAFRFAGRDVSAERLNGKWSVVRLPKIGWVRFRDTRPRRGRTVNVSVSQAANGWHVCFGCEIEHEVPANRLPRVGIDRGIANTIALSTGEMLSTPPLTRLERRKRRGQHMLARRDRGSNRYRKQRAMIVGISGKIARVRADWRHRATLAIAKRFGTVAIEALKIPNMTAAGRGKRGLNRSILEQGWGAFERVLAYKLEERGGALVKVNPAYTSQECSACGTIDKASRESQASFACRHCGFAAHADHNAALNILRRSTPSVEDAGCGSVEARTINLAA